MKYTKEELKQHQRDYVNRPDVKARRKARTTEIVEELKATRLKRIDKVVNGYIKTLEGMK